jgi:hypothetical protein
MPIPVRDNGGTFERPDAGMHQGVCTNVYGPFHEQYEWNGKQVNAEKVVIMWELDQLIKDGEFKGKRFTTSQSFTASLADKSKLRPFLESWRGKAFTQEELAYFDLEKLIGVNCTLNLIEKEKRGGGKTTVIQAIMPKLKDTEKMVPELPRDHCPKWIKDKIEAAGGTTAASAPDHFEDDIPF